VDPAAGGFDDALFAECYKMDDEDDDDDNMDL